MQQTISLTRDQKEAMGLLQVGTFLEYFDLMLYVHMAVLLNELFFPKTDPKTASLIAAFAFCSTYLLRPFGALIFGYIGDHIGRKTTVILTTMIMATSCIIMATLPTYAQIGITATWLVTACRIAQGLSSMGEIVGAEIYITEITKPPARYPAVSFIACASRFGTVAALAVAMLVTSFGFDWRNAFWLGAAIALVGSVARTRLRETPDFVDMKRRMNLKIKESQRENSAQSISLLQERKTLEKQTISWKMFCGYLFISLGTPLSVYFNYIYCGNILKTLGYSAEFVIHQNFFVALVELFSMVIVTFLSSRIHPLKILKFRTLLAFPFLMAAPFLLMNATTSSYIFCVQIIGASLSLLSVPADAVMISHFPVFKRFTYISLVYAFSRAGMSVVTSFGLVYLTDFFGYSGLYFLFVPIFLGFLWAITIYEKLEHIYKGSLVSKIFKSRKKEREGVEKEDILEYKKSMEV